MTTTAQVFEPGTPEEGLLAHFLEHAKENHVKYPHGLEPTAFVFGGSGRLSIVSLARVWTNDDARDEAAEILKDIARREKATVLGIASDCWRTSFEDMDKIRAAGLDVRRYREWPEKARQRFCVRREAIMLSIETQGDFKVLCQFYRRDRGKIIWEELEVSDDHGVEGRFVGLLPRKGGAS